MEIYDTIVVGTGPAGLSAGMYAGRFNLKTLVIGADFGGYTSKAGIIYNYPGARQIDGYDLTKIIKDQAVDAGAIFVDENVSGIEEDGEFFKVHLKDNFYLAKSLILATGSERKKLGLTNEKELEGKGVHYCVTCDGPVYVGKEIAIIGGGYAAAKSAILASQYAKKIYLLVAGAELNAEHAMIEVIKRAGEKIEIVTNIQVKEIKGSNKLDSVVLSRELNGKIELRLDGVFVEIGSIPSNQIAKSLGVIVDEKGYVIVDPFMKTNVPGIFVAGDLANLFGGFKQNITATAMGALASNSAYQYFKSLKS